MSTLAAAQPQDSLRFSTYSGAPSIHPSIAPTMESNRSNTANGNSAEPKEKNPPTIVRSPSSASSAVDPRSAELKEWAAGFERMTDRRLEEQRFIPSGQKTDEISTNALGAKLERALGRRMSEQDAHYKNRELDEKVDEKAIPVAAQ